MSVPELLGHEHSQMSESCGFYTSGLPFVQVSVELVKTLDRRFRGIKGDEAKL